VLIEEMRALIHLASNFTGKDIGKEIQEIPVHDSDEGVVKIKKNMYNCYIALHFNQFDVSQKKYSDIINLYEDLPEEKKADVYKEIERLFNEIKYLVSVEK
jgi:hypothetical protein